MVRARWWVLAVLSLVTATAVILVSTGVLDGESPTATEPPPLQFTEPATVTSSLTVVDPFAADAMSAKPRRVLANRLGAASLGPRVSAAVLSAQGAALFQQAAAKPVMPASTLKLLTALSVLDAMPADRRIETTVYQGNAPNEIVLVGGGDATLAVERARRPGLRVTSLEQLARETVANLDVARVRLTYDDSLFTGPAVSPRWEPIYVASGVIAPVTSLMAGQGLVSDDGLSRYPDPAAAAASDFAQLLENEGIRIRGDVRPARASAVGEPIAGVLSPPVADLVEWMLRTSDNQLAEALGRLAAIERQLPGSFSGAVGAMGVAADSAGVAVDVDRLYDASGLSRDDRITAAALAHVLGLAAVDPALRPITLGLPVAGFDGTLADRYQELPQRQAAGLVRAKTGTLTGIAAEAGMAVGCDGNLMVFAFIADRVPDTEPARSALDKATATLTTCP